MPLPLAVDCLSAEMAWLGGGVLGIDVVITTGIVLAWLAKSSCTAIAYRGRSQKKCLKALAAEFKILWLLSFPHSLQLAFPPTPLPSC